MNLRNWVILILIASSTLGAASCDVQNPNPAAPGLHFKAKLYATDSSTMSIVRKNASSQTDIISCNDKRFDGRVCITIDEYKKHLQDLNNLSYECLQWRSR